jgi:hypothetical protein
MAWAITNGPRLDMGLWRMCKYEVLLLVITELSYYVNLKESELKRGCLRGVLKMLCSTRNWQITLFDLCDHEK